MKPWQKWIARNVLGLTIREPPTKRQLEQRMYAAAVPDRFNQGFPSFNTSEDLELVSSLRNLRARARILVRDAPYAKSARRVIVNNVIGTGVRMQAAVKTSRGDYNDRINDSIESAWIDWMQGAYCHTGGSMHFHDIERMCMGQVFEAGEVFIRIHRQKFGASQVPIALEIVEPERIVDGYAYPGAVAADSGGVRMGIETDKFKKPIAYWIRDLHPGDIRMDLEQNDKVTRVDAADVIHLYVIDRWPQTRGVPWLHAAAGKLQDISGYTEAEIIAARGAASYLGMLESPEDVDTFAEQEPDNTFQLQLEPGMVGKLQPGEKMNWLKPDRPNSALDPFMRYLLREIAAAVGVSYESLSHDYSQGSYSSMRISLLDERDVWRTLQQWWIRSFRERLHKEWLYAAMLARAIPEISLDAYGVTPEKFQLVNFRPRGWSWIDPTKEVAAYKDAVKGGFKTISDVIAETGNGMDLEDFVKARRAELDYLDEEQLPFDTSPRVYVPAESRGQVLVDDAGDVVPAAELAANAQAQAQAAIAEGAAAAPGAPTVGQGSKPVPEKPEPAPAEGDDDGDRSAVLDIRRRARLRQ